MKNIDSLKNTSQFKEVYENGKSKANGLLVLYALYVGGEDQKLGISVSKKVGNSVVRHRTTRLIRESFLKIRDELPKGYHFVVVARVYAAGKSFSDICGALFSIAKKMELVSSCSEESL